MSTFKSYWGQCCSKIVHDLVNLDNNRESKDILEGNLYIVTFETWLLIDVGIQLHEY
jgi:hypothetical protein